MNVIPLHDPSKITPSMPVGAPACSFCHEQKPKGRMVSKVVDNRVELAICFDCAGAAALIMAGVYEEELS